MTGRADSWCLETPGLGFGILGSVAVPHPDANWYDVPGEIGWGGLAGTAWAADRREGLVVLTFCQVMYELWIDEEVRQAARKALGYSASSGAAKAVASNTPAKGAADFSASAATESGPCRANADNEALLGHIPEASTPLPKGSGAAKRALDHQDLGEETPKRSRLSSDTIMSKGSTEKFKMELEPFSLPLPELVILAKEADAGGQ
uniref:Uncharacterized protein n=1 Tax=Pyrodinium bahamense TaxID=73915 RepID=A0A7S0A8A9_9DINO